MKILNILLSAGLSLLLFQSCDKLDAPFKNKSAGNDTTTKVRKILLEDFTGHLCVNCPKAGKITEDLKEIYGRRMIVLAIHAGSQALPDPGNGLPEDFRCPAGDSIYNFFEIPYNPIGMIDRMVYKGNRLIDYPTWGEAVDSLYDLPLSAFIKIEPAYDAGSRKVTASVSTEFITPASGEFKLCVYLSEDSIVAPQRNTDPNSGPVPVITDYVFHHMLRGAVNSVWGDKLTDGSVLAGTTFTKSYTYTLNSAWNENHCYLVAFVYNTDTKEILQVEEQKIK